MSEQTKTALIAIAALVVLALASFWVVGEFVAYYKEGQKQQSAKEQVEFWAQRLDELTDGKGGYVQHEPDLYDPDPWGTSVRVSYSSGEFLNWLKVSSAGPDKKFGTKDDIIAERKTGSVLKSIQNVGESATKGAVKGVREGIKGDEAENK